MTIVVGEYQRAFYGDQFLTTSHKDLLLAWPRALPTACGGE
ncbi:hypothetical protein [Amycolatopsis sp. DSM 110486]|nr:hypothetical protein [Amycolatopsis sp. DSM 110486]